MIGDHPCAKAALLIVLAFLPHGRAAGPEALEIVRAGRPVATLVLPSSPDAWDAKAAEWIRDYVLKSTGAELPVVREPQRPAGAMLSVGPTRLAEEAGVSRAGLQWDGCRMKVVGNTLFLLGRDEPTVDEGCTGARGTCRAAVTFLERFVGVRWFLPVPEGVLIPKHRDITVPADLDATVTPAFAYVHGRYPYGIATPGAIANNYRTAIRVLTYGGHAYYLWLPAEKYFADHPEYFALRNGVRTGEGNHLCSTNPDVRRILLEGIRQEFDRGYDWVALGQEDGYEPCECPECDKRDRYRAVMGPRVTDLKPGETTWKDYLARFRSAPCERMLSLHRYIVDECRKSHPDKTVHMLVYWPSLIPGKSFEGYRDNLVGEVAFYNDPLELDVMDLWKDKARGLTVMVTWFDLTTGKGTAGVMMTPREVSDRMRAYHARKVIGLYGIHEANWGFQGPCFYVMGRMAGDPGLDWSALVDEYCDGLYGSAGRAMRAFFDRLYTRSMCGFGYQWKTRELGSIEDRHRMMYPRDFLQQLDARLRTAEREAVAAGGNVPTLVALTRLNLDYLSLVTRVLDAHAAFTAEKTPARRTAWERAVGDFNAFRLRVLTLDDAATTAWPAHDLFCKFLVGDGDDNNYYMSWAKRRAQITLDKLAEIAPGYSGCVMRDPFGIGASGKVRGPALPGG